jgi:hypothetical protein
MQQMKADVVVFDGRIEFDRNWRQKPKERTPREMGRAIRYGYHGVR